MYSRVDDDFMGGLWYDFLSVGSLELGAEMFQGLMIIDY